MFKIRFGETKDIPILVRMSRDFFESSHYFKTNVFNPETVKKTIEDNLSKPKEQSILLILEKDEKVVGFIAGLAFHSFFSDDYFAVEHLWWVDPEYRSSKSLLLLKSLEQWASHIGCSKLIITGQKDQTDLKKVLSRFNYTEIEYTFTKEL